MLCYLLGLTLIQKNKIQQIQGSDKFMAEQVVKIPGKNLKDWMLPKVPALLSDIIISMDDKYLYMSCWLHGEVRQYDISKPNSPKLVGQVRK